MQWGWSLLGTKTVLCKHSVRYAVMQGAWSWTSRIERLTAAVTVADSIQSQVNQYPGRRRHLLNACSCGSLAI